MPTGTAYGARGFAPVMVIACLVSALLTASCTSGAGSAAELPSVSALPSTSVTGSPPSTTTTSSTPSVASATPTSAKAAVEAAVRAYYAAVNTAISTGETTELAKLTDKGCPCAKLIASVRTLFKDGYTRGAHWTLHGTTVESVTGRVANTEVIYRTEKYSELDRTGKVIHTYPAVDTKSNVILTREGSTWKVSNYFLLSGRDVKS